MSERTQIVVRLLDEFERIGDDHEELTDTDVRESIHLSLNLFFVWGREPVPFPCNFGMESEEGDQLVARAVSEFIRMANESECVRELELGRSRLELLQADEAVSSRGNKYDLFYGFRDQPLPPEPLPKLMFEAGEYSEDFF